ncbi:hypothetical protein Bca4012_100661 [Brassica carinata]|uniref:Uncharacterized protein n=1 Tax=Brassica carinata TaxID=52824 RepID=A0A8X7TSU1_BRACI|nr:hypothetical protein Bca52824_083143 [Brassica carinata]
MENLICSPNHKTSKQHAQYKYQFPISVMLLFILSPFQARDLMAISSIKLDGLSLILATIAWRIRFRLRKDATIHLL